MKSYTSTHRYNGNVAQPRFLRKGVIESQLMASSEGNYAQGVPGFAAQDNVQRDVLMVLKFKIAKRSGGRASNHPTGEALFHANYYTVKHSEFYCFLSKRENRLNSPGSLQGPPCLDTSCPEPIYVATPCTTDNSKNKLEEFV